MSNQRSRSDASQMRSEVKTRNDKIRELREHAGLSMEELAKAMGFKGQSSIQRYLGPDYDKGFRPELARKFIGALLGKGNPPLTKHDLEVFFEWQDPVNTSDITFQLISDPSQPAFANPNDISRRIKTSLPVAEGIITLEIPMPMSAWSVDVFKIWSDHLMALAVLNDQEVGSKPQELKMRTRKK